MSVQACAMRVHCLICFNKDHQGANTVSTISCGDTNQYLDGITYELSRRGTVVTRWICFVQAPGLIPGGKAHSIFRFVSREASHVSKEVDGNPLAC